MKEGDEFKDELFKMVGISQSADYVIVLEKKRTGKSLWDKCKRIKSNEKKDQKEFDFNKHFMNYYLEKKLNLVKDRDLFEYTVLGKKVDIKTKKELPKI